MSSLAGRLSSSKALLRGRTRAVRRLGAATAVAALALAGGAWSAPAAAGPPAQPASSGAAAKPASSGAAALIRVGTTRYQAVNGFGFSDAFGQVANLQAMPAPVRSAVVKLLFSPTSGAGLDIVRFGLGGAGNVSDQLWLGRQALQHGVHTFYADSWSAPGSMKTNGSVDNGGYLCGVPGEACVNGDFRQAYADFLAAQAKAFAAQGLPLRAVDFVNEPEIGPGYPSMLMTPAQAANFVPYLGRALAREHLRTRVACCDAEGWANAPGFAGAQAYTRAVLGNPRSARYVGLITGHGYTSAPTFPLTSRRPVWETEWSTFQKWDPSWNDGTSASGLTWANNIYTALTQADVNGFLYWWGTTTYAENGDNEGLIMLGTPASSTAATYQASGRLWAFAAFSRFVRPGSVRLATTSSVATLDAVAFADGAKRVLVVINNSTSSQQAQVSFAGPAGRSSAMVQPYLTDASANGTAQAPIDARNRSFVATIPPQAVVSYVVTASRP